MKKIALLLIVALMLCSFVACGGNNEDVTTTEATTQEEKVVISINKERVADEAEFLIGISEIEGITSTKNDNFYVLTMSQEVHKKLLDTKRAEAVSKYDAVEAQGGFYEKFECDKHLTTVKVFVDREGFDAAGDSVYMNLISIGAVAMSYQMFVTEEPKTAVTVIYSDTEEVAYTLSLPIEM